MKWVGVLGILFLFTAACDGELEPTDDDDTGGVENDPGEMPDDPPDDPPDDVATIQVSGYVGEFVDGFPPFAGVEVSIVDRPDIAPVLTDAAGNYVFEAVPAGIEIIVYADLDETKHPAASRYLQLGDSDFIVAPLFLFDRAATPFLAGMAGVEYDETMGYLTGGVWRDTDEVLEGAVVTLSPASATVTYNGADGLPNPELDGISPGGTFGFYNVPIGDYEFSASHASTSRCYSALADQPETVRVRMFPGAATFSMGFSCGD